MDGQKWHHYEIASTMLLTTTSPYAQEDNDNGICKSYHNADKRSLCIKLKHCIARLMYT